MKHSNYIKAIYLTIFLSFSTTIIVYIINFSSLDVSKNTADWGTFGDYFGGVLNPITALINILVFIYLTKVIAKTEELSNLNNLEYHKKLTLAELKHHSYIEFADKLDDLPRILFNEELNKYADETTLLIIYVQSFIENMTHLFPLFENKKNTENLLESMKKIIQKIEEIQNEKNEETRKIFLKELRTLFSYYFVEKSALIKKMQQEMLR
ncbi:MAG: hypothetical protein WBM13_01025 [Bacteroidia bacterium]